MRRIKKYFMQKLSLDPVAQIEYYVQPIFQSYQLILNNRFLTEGVSGQVNDAKFSIEEKLRIERNRKER